MFIYSLRCHNVNFRGLVRARNEGATGPVGRREVDVKLPGKENLNSHCARPVHLIITMTKWIRTSRSSTKNSLL